ncbi:acetate kinase [Nocardioides sp. CER19]|uniref:acetate kinase n=1 Tax=Nocardioides sp. CER19 TaxID=3038538 RepID=UPI0024482F83|nr:acetate kinase [Nocardioides sp. CER19]MDH2413304.1 acetate kinase [Nocardioides sp. CER19]
MVAVLVLNAGSSSLKYQVVEPDGTRHLKGLVERVDESGFPAALARMTAELEEAGLSRESLAAVGHRVVHGGPDFSDPVLITDDVLTAIADLARFAPLHNPPAVEGIRAAREEFPDVPHAAVFDTAFFTTLPPASATYAIDAGVAAEHGIKRYGAHGTSHRFVSAAAAAFAGRPLDGLRQIVLHLGNGASVAALRSGRPMDTSMGLTPLEGLVMGTRAGDLDPGVLLHLLRAGLSVSELDELLQHRSGLQGLAGRHDMRDLTAAMAAGDPTAQLAYEVYVHRLRKYIGAYFAALGGVDQVVFTGGVGEHQASVRGAALDGLSAMGLAVDPARNDQPPEGPREISPAGAPVQVLVVPTDEELEIAREVVALLPR